MLNLKLKKLVITGGLSCGKSTVCRIFQTLGAYVISADEIVHQLLSPDTQLGQQVIELIGSDILKNGCIDRSAIAMKVFRDRELLSKLENLIHPVVRTEIEKKYQEISKKGTYTLFVAEIPLYFEKGLRDFDATLTVLADETTSQDRFTKSTGLDREEYQRRMRRQLSPQEKANLSDYVIVNNGSLHVLEDQVKSIFNQLGV